jgi:hypothetical protein
MLLLLYSQKNPSRGMSRREPPGERGNRGKMANEAGDIGDEDGGIPRLIPQISKGQVSREPVALE